MRLFRRHLRVVLSSATGFFVGSSEQTELRSLEDLRIVATIVTNMDSSPNTASIQIYNANETTRAFIQRKNTRLELFAGYEGGEERAFSGDITWSETTTQGGDRITEIECGHGARAFRGARIAKGFSKGTDARTIFRELASTMGLKLPTSISDVAELGKIFTQGVTLQGPSAREMSKMARSLGLTASIQEGSMVIQRPGGTLSVEAPLLTPETGLIGSPAYAQPREGSNKPLFKFSALYQPNLRAGRLVRVESRRANGTFAIQTSTARLDNKSSGFTVDCEALAR